MISELDYDCIPPLVEYCVDSPLGPVRVWGSALVAAGLPDSPEGAQILAYQYLDSYSSLGPAYDD